MAGIAGFSDLFAQLNTFSRFPSAQVPVAQQEAPEDGSPLLSRIQSNQRGASFDLAGPVAPEMGETYRPPQAQRRLGMSFNFEFNLSIQQAVVRRVSPGGGGEGSYVQALEAAGRSYRSSTLSSRQDLGGSFVQARRFQADLFYSRTRELSTRLEPAQGERFESTSRQVARTFEVSISLDASFLSQFVGQSERLSGEDAALFDQYLNHTDLLAGSGDMLKAFFDDVGRILAESEGFLQASLGDFFQGVAGSFGLSAEEAGALQGMVADEITAFFDEMEGFLADARGGMTGFDEPPEVEGEQVEEQATLV